MSILKNLNCLFVLNLSGYKEASFTYALAAAGVLHQIARACSLGKIAACGCEAKPVSNEFEWQGCSHDLGFGAKYSRKFLQSLEDEYSIPAVMQTHNSKVGRKVRVFKEYPTNYNISISTLGK